MNYSISISDDYYKAVISMEFTEEDEKITSDEILNALAGRNISFGIKHEVIHQLVNDNKEVYGVVIAEGIPHINGVDAMIHMVHNVQEAKPIITEDGSVDYKNIASVDIIHKNDVIATKKPLTKGKNGTTVTGKTIRAKAGKDRVFKYGKNIALKEDGLSIYSLEDGTLKIDRAGKAEVLEVLEIKNGVGVESGNISFLGDVIINGNVLDGYSVKTEGDIVVNGIVEGATLTAKGSITITKGIQGHDEAFIECGGDLVSNFINSASVKVAGNMEVNSIMNSTVKCDGEITMKGKKGAIVGGDLICKGHVEAKQIGSELGIITNIKLGVDTEILDELRQLTSEVKELSKNYDIQIKSIRTLSAKIKKNPEDGRSIFMLSKVKKNYDATKEELEAKQNKLRTINEFVNNILGSKLKAGSIFPGVRVKIGSSTYHVKEALTQVIITKEKGEIVAIGY